MCRQVSSSSHYTASVKGLTRRLPATTVVWAIIAINVAVYAATELAGGSTNRRVLLEFGAKVNPLIAQGEYWRLFTCAFLHVGLTHLLFNMFALMSFGRLAEMIFGHARFLAIYIVGALSGSLFSYLFSSSVSAGASGAIFGVAGALSMFYVRNRGVQAVAGQGELSGMVVMLAINGVFGFIQPNIDNWAHLGGLIGGAFIGAVLSPRIAWVVDEEGNRVGLRRELPPMVNWAYVPTALVVIGIAATRFRGA